MVDSIQGIDSDALASRVALLQSSRITQTPTATETGVVAGSVQREAQVRLSADLITIQAQTETSASRTTFLRVASTLNLAANDLNLPQAAVISPDDFTPDSVAGRLVDFASQFVAEARTVEEFNNIFSEVEAAIAAGFEQTREILDEVNALTGNVEAAVDEIEGLVNAGLARLSPPDDLAPATVISTLLPATEI